MSGKKILLSVSPRQTSIAHQAERRKVGGSSLLDRSIGSTHTRQLLEQVGALAEGPIDFLIDGAGDGGGRLQLVDALDLEYRAWRESNRCSKVAASDVDRSDGGLQIVVGLGARGSGLEFVGLGGEPVREACLRVLFDGLGVFEADFRCLALTFGVEEAVIGRGDLINDAAMGIIEREIGSQQVGFGRVDFPSTSADVEDQVLDMQNGLKDAFRLAVKELADESRVTEGDGECNRRHGG